MSEIMWKLSISWILRYVLVCLWSWLSSLKTFSTIISNMNQVSGSYSSFIQSLTAFSESSASEGLVRQYLTFLVILIQLVVGVSWGMMVARLCFTFLTSFEMTVAVRTVAAAFIIRLKETRNKNFANIFVEGDRTWTS